MPYFALIIIFYHVKIACYHGIKVFIFQEGGEATIDLMGAASSRV